MSLKNIFALNPIDISPLTNSWHCGHFFLPNFIIQTLLLLIDISVHDDNWNRPFPNRNSMNKNREAH